MTTVMAVTSGIRATLLALTFFWVGASLPHVYSSARAFFLESLPSIVSAAMAPGCLFVFSNIIVAVLVGESKLSRRRGAPRNTTDNVAPATATDTGMVPERKEELTVVMEPLLPTLTGEINHEQENNIVEVTAEDNGSSVFSEALQMEDHCNEEADPLYLRQVDEAHGEVEDVGEPELVQGEEVSWEEEEARSATQELQDQTDLSPADELNRRVEDFIARFNMERQLEAKMLVCCY